MINVNDKVRTNQYPHTNKEFIVLKLMEGKFFVNKEEVLIVACKERITGLIINLVYSLLYKIDDPDNWTNEQVIKLAKAGNKIAIIQHIKRFKKLPKKSDLKI